MNWKTHVTKEGRVEWHGIDSIVDPFNKERKHEWIYHEICCWVGMVVSYCLACMMFELARRAVLEDLDVSAVLTAIGFGIAGLLIGAFALALTLFTFFLHKEPEPFYTRHWLVAIVDGKLAYRAGEFDGPLDPGQVSRHGDAWEVALDDIARVESGLTRDWQPARYYPGREDILNGLGVVPDHEYQTFLLLKDGARRVIQTLNADRENSVTLAHSIRAWLEENRVTAPVIRIREGFDI